MYITNTLEGFSVVGSNISNISIKLSALIPVTYNI